MWSAIRDVSTGLTLIAFCIAAVVVFLRYRLRSHERQLMSAPEETRAGLIQALSDRFIVPSLAIDPSDLSEKQKYNILLEQIRHRSRRFYVVAILVLVLGVLLGIVTLFAINMTTQARSPSQVADATSLPLLPLPVHTFLDTRNRILSTDSILNIENLHGHSLDSTARKLGLGPSYESPSRNE
jgi:hypothetical protein